MPANAKRYDVLPRSPIRDPGAIPCRICGRQTGSRLSAGGQRNVPSSGPPFLVVILACMVAPNASTPGAIMLPTIAGIILLGALALASSVAAQPTPPPSVITRTVIAATKLLTVTEGPLFFRAVSVTIPRARAACRRPTASSTKCRVRWRSRVNREKMLNPGEGLFIAAGRTVTLKAGSSVPSTFLHFFLAPAGDLDSPAEVAPATVKELYRLSAPVSGPEAGQL